MLKHCIQGQVASSNKKSFDANVLYDTPVLSNDQYPDKCCKSDSMECI